MQEKVKNLVAALKAAGVEIEVKDFFGTTYIEIPVTESGDGVRTTDELVNLQFRYAGDDAVWIESTYA